MSQSDRQREQRRNAGLKAAASRWSVPGASTTHGKLISDMRTQQILALKGKRPDVKYKDDLSVKLGSDLIDELWRLSYLQDLTPAQLVREYVLAGVSRDRIVYPPQPEDHNDDDHN